MPALLLALAFAAGEPHRPLFHFTPARHWMNDPNGMVFFDGEYHLFFQYNPLGDTWGHMSWGHAVSRDLLRWDELPVALREEDGVMAFSGSAVVDWKNTSGFGRDGKPPLVAVYTGHHTGKPLQTQNLASSTDRGRTWTKFAGNPVLDLGEKDFRDPKVFWHEPTRRWVMVVAWPDKRKVRLYASPDLKAWTHLSDFGPAGSAAGIWECPDLFPLAVEGGGERWVLVVNVGSGAPAGGSGCQYFVGGFDGTRFTPAGDATAPLWADRGPDFYAAVSWGDVPAADGRRLWLGWMSNWEYANDVPTAPWRGAMTVPRELALRPVGGGWRLVQRPVREVERLRGDKAVVPLADVAGRADLSPLVPVTAGPFDLTIDLQPSADAAFTLALRTGPAEETVLRVDVPGRTLALDRTRSGAVGFSPKFPGTATAPLRLTGGRLVLRVVADASSVEVFADDGEAVLTSLVLPTSPACRLALGVTRGRLTRGTVTGWPLTPPRAK